MSGHGEDHEVHVMEEIRDIAEELYSNFHESMFLENDFSDDCMKPILEEYMNTHVRAVFIGNTKAYKKSERTCICPEKSLSHQE